MHHHLLCATSLLYLLGLAAPAFGYDEKPQPVSVEQATELAKKAPDIREKLTGLGLKLRPVDYIDCTNPDDPHQFMDQGTSQIVELPIGKARITAAHRHAYFGYRFRRAEKDTPHLIVYEYPDDIERTITFATHESGLSGRSNIDWSLETTVYTGKTLPHTGTWQRHTFIMWPQDEAPVAMVGNWIRAGAPAACRRIYVYAIEGGLPRLEVSEPDPTDPRLLGGFYSTPMLPVNMLFGLKSAKSPDHMADYYAYIGQNVVSYSVIWNNTWAFRCKIPAWDQGDKSEELDRVLAALDKKGGMHFIASFAIGGHFTVGGKAISKMTTDELKKAMVEGFDQFLERYGKYKSLRGISFGSMFGINFFDLLQAKGVASDLIAHIKAKRPDLLVQTYVGGKALHKQYFDDAWDVVQRWESGDKPWGAHLGDEALANWRNWKHDPAELRKMEGLEVSEQYQPDDHRIFDLYSQQPRSHFYYDLDRSAARSKHVNSRVANIWDTHLEAWWGLDTHNFWYRKLWVAPAGNPPPPYSLAHWTRIQEHRDRTQIVAGAWNGKHFGWEEHMRRFAKAFRELPRDELQDVAVDGADSVIVRWLEKEGTRYVTLLNVTPFAAEASVDGTAHKLPPYEMQTLVEKGKSGAPKVIATATPEYAKWLTARFENFAQTLAAVKALNAEAAPTAFEKHLAAAKKLLDAGQARAADLALGVGLLEELQLRKDILDPPTWIAPKLATAPASKGDLDAWPTEAFDLKAGDGTYLASHLYMPNSWNGPTDLSARLRLAHDGERIFIGVHVRDQVLEKLDGLSLAISTDGAYRNWRGMGQKRDINWSIAVPVDGKTKNGSGAKGFAYTCTRVKDGYLVEGSAPLADLGIKPGGDIGFAAWISDGDKTSNVKDAGWARETIMMVPNRSNFPYWSDARACGRVKLGE